MACSMPKLIESECACVCVCVCKRALMALMSE